MGHWERVCFKSQPQQQQQYFPQQQQQQPQQQQPQQQPQQRRQQQRGTSAAMWPVLMATDCDKRESGGFCELSIRNRKVDALMDSGSLSRSFIDKKLAAILGVKVRPCKKAEGVTMANSSFTSKVEGECFVNFTMQNRKYSNVKLLVLENLCADIILGQDFMGQHKSVVFEFGGCEPSLHISALTAMNVPPPSLFEHLTDDCKPVAVKYNNSNFIHEETQKLLQKGIIKQSTSPWRAQVLVVSDDDGTHKKGMVIDCKQTINKFTELDAYPLPDSEQMVRDISKYSWFST